MTFNQAFAQARREGKKVFMWQGRPIKVELKQKYAPTTVGMTHKPAQEIDPSTGRVTTTTGTEFVVNAPRKYIKKDNKKLMFGLMPVDWNDRVFQDTNTKQFYITDNKGEIVGTTMSEDAARNYNFSYYQGNQQRDANRSAALQEVVDESNASVRHYDPRKAITQEQLDADIRNARSGFVNAINGMVNTPNNAIAGAIRLGFDPDYRWRDYYKSLSPYSGINNQTIGIGDIFNIKNENARFLSNLVTPASLLMSASTFEPGKLVPNKRLVGSHGTIRVSDPSAYHRTYTRSGSSNRIPVRMDGRGYAVATRQPNGYLNRFGGSQTINIDQPTQYTYAFTPDKMRFIPYSNYRADYENVPKNEEYTSSYNWVDADRPTLYHKQLFITGDRPKGGALKWNPTTRESLHRDEDQVYRGLEGNGRYRYSSSIGSVSKNPPGYNTKGN